MEELNVLDCVDFLISIGADVPREIVSADKLAEHLSSGVVLGDVIAQLDSDRKITHHCPQQFQMHANAKEITSFLKGVCGIPEESIFEEWDLVDTSLMKFDKVVITLSVVSQNQTFKKLVKDKLSKDVNEFQPFSEYSNFENFGDFDPIYCDTEDIYSTMVVDESIFRQAPTDKTEKVLAEILSTETAFVEVLNLLKEMYMKNMKGFIVASKIKDIFNNCCLLQLHNLHSNILRDLDDINVSTVVRVFLSKKQEITSLYSEYYLKVEKAKEVIARFDPIVTQKIEEIQHRIANNNWREFPLKSVILVPAQRVLKYSLLFDSLLKERRKADADQSELEELQNLTNQFINMNEFFNQAKREASKRFRMAELQSSLDSEEFKMDVTVFGTLCFESDCKVNKQKAYALLFTRALLVTPVKPLPSKPQKIRHEIQFSDYVLARKTDTNMTFKCNVLGNDQSIVIEINNPQFHQEFERNIEDILELNNQEYQNFRQHEFLLTDFACPTPCTVCSKFLNGLLTQGFKCNDCHSSVHKECIREIAKCSSHKIPPKEKPELSNWYVENMDREAATVFMNFFTDVDGVFLVRKSVSHGGYAITFTYEKAVHHIKLTNSGTEYNPEYYLCQSDKFPSLNALVNYYQETSLLIHFSKFDTRLVSSFASKIEEIKNSYLQTNQPYCGLAKMIQTSPSLKVRIGEILKLRKGDTPGPGYLLTENRLKNLMMVPKDCLEIL